MPVPDEVVSGWVCVPNPDGKDCRAEWMTCDDCDGEEDMDEVCPICTGSGGGYICSTHDTSPFFTKLY